MVQVEGQVRTGKESKRVRSTYFLDTEGQIRIRKESEQARGTHPLDSADGEMSQDME
jgi:hypothetical protein